MNKILTTDNLKIIYNFPNDTQGILSNENEIPIFINSLLYCCFLLRNKLYFKYLLNSCGYQKKNLFIPLMFDSVIFTKVNKLSTKLQGIEFEFINKLINIIESDTTLLFNVDELQAYLLNNYPDVYSIIEGFIFPLLNLFYKNNYNYGGKILIPKFRYYNTVCFVDMYVFNNFVYEMKKDKLQPDFQQYFLSFKLNIRPINRKELLRYSLEIINYLSCFSEPLFSSINNNDYLIFNLFNIYNNDYIRTIKNYITINPSIRLLLVLYYNNNLATIYDDKYIEGLIQQDEDENVKLNSIKSIVEIIKSIGNLDNTNLKRLLNEELLELNIIRSGSIPSELLALEQISNNEYKLLTNIDISLEEDNDDDMSIEDTETDLGGEESEDPTSEDDDDNSDDNSPDEDTSGDDDNNEPEDNETENEDEEENKEPSSKFGLQLDTEEPTIDSVLEKIMYYKKLSQILENSKSNINDSVETMIYYWLRYWIFLVNIDTTKKFFNKVKKLINND